MEELERWVSARVELPELWVDNGGKPLVPHGCSCQPFGVVLFLTHRWRNWDSMRLQGFLFLRYLRGIGKVSTWSSDAQSQALMSYHFASQNGSSFSEEWLLCFIHIFTSLVPGARPGTSVYLGLSWLSFSPCPTLLVSRKTPGLMEYAVELG